MFSLTCLLSTISHGYLYFTGRLLKISVISLRVCKYVSQNLDALHNHLSTIYPSMRTPSFCVTEWRDGTLMLHERSGLEHVVIGMVRTVAKKLHNKNIKVRSHFSMFFFSRTSTLQNFPNKHYYRIFYFKFHNIKYILLVLKFLPFHLQYSNKTNNVQFMLDQGLFCGATLCFRPWMTLPIGIFIIVCICHRVTIFKVVGLSS